MDAELDSLFSEFLQGYGPDSKKVATNDVQLIQGGRDVLSSLYRTVVDQLKTLDSETRFSGALSKELYTDGFDVEQIWMQLEKCIRPAAILRARRMERMNGSFRFISEDIEADVDHLLGERKVEEQEGPENVDEADLLNSTEEDGDDGKGVEDSFLKISEMQMFIDEAENADRDETADEDNDLLGLMDRESEESDGIDIFAKSDTEEDETAAVIGRSAMYTDMYLPRNQQQSKKTEIGKSTVADQSLVPSRLMQERESMRQTIGELEEEAVGDKEWPFRGEVGAGDRPLNSALEVDLDYDTTVRPPPRPTQEHMDSIEDLIKKRIAQLQFDDVERVIPPPIEENNQQAPMLDDKKAEKGLGEIYADAHVRNVHGSGTLEEKEERLRVQARQLFKEVCLKLDALTHFQFAPKPVIEDMSVKVNVPTIRMEESVATGPPSTKAPEEIYQPSVKTGEVVTEKEMTKEQRKKLRSKRKRSYKTRNPEEKKRSVTLSGRKSLIHSYKTRQKPTKAKQSTKKADTSSSIFKRLQALKEGDTQLGMTEMKATEKRRKSLEVKL